MPWAGIHQIRRWNSRLLAVTLQEGVQIAQILSPILAAVGIFVSVMVGVRALRNSRQDRLLKIMPKLVFNLGAQAIRFRCEKGKSIPGIDISEVQKALSDLDDEIRLNIPELALSGLFNHGNGQALNIEATFVPYTVTVRGVESPVDPQQLSKFPFSVGWNTFPTIPSHLDAGEEARVFRIPTIVVVDPEKVLQKVSGRMYIRCQDGGGQSWTSVQPVSVFVDYDASSDTGVATFSFGKEVGTPVW
jgi:hypothetical protein